MLKLFVMMIVCILVMLQIVYVLDLFTNDSDINK